MKNYYYIKIYFLFNIYNLMEDNYTEVTDEEFIELYLSNKDFQNNEYLTELYENMVLNVFVYYHKFVIKISCFYLISFQKLL